MVPQSTFNIWRTFLFHKSFFVVKESSSDYTKVRKLWLFKEPLNGSLWNQKWFFYGIAVKTFEAPLFWRVHLTLCYSLDHLEVTSGVAEIYPWVSSA